MESPRSEVAAAPVAGSGRYAKQTRFAALGLQGQERLRAATALVCGVGALGAMSAQILVRAGVGRVRIVDRDFVDLTNLHRQFLYDEADVAAGLPKAEAAAVKLRRMNSEVTVEAVVADVDWRNAAELAAGVDCIVDGTDNFETRFLLNDLSLERRIPWVYGGCVGCEGRIMAVLPGETPCLRCILPEAPPPGSLPTCDSAGVLGPIVGVVASCQALEAMKILSGRTADVHRGLLTFDLWGNHLKAVDLRALRDGGGCAACGPAAERPWLSGKRGSAPIVLCGRNAVQLTPPEPRRLEWPSLAARLQSVGEVTYNAFLLRLETAECRLTLFRDGRAIIGGTEDPAVARTWYDRYVGG